MESKTLFILGIVGIILGGVFIINLLSPQEGGVEMEQDNENNKVHLGPVPQGYDEEHFRKTGITKKIGDKE